MGSLIVRTILGFAFLMLVLALALFIPAGSLRFWQAQVYLTDFAVCTILITAYLIKYDQELLAGRVKAWLVECAAGPELDCRRFRGAWLLHCFPGIQRKQLFQSHHRSVS